MKKFLLLILAVVGVCILGGSVAFAQGVTTASMHGVVVDGKGATLPGATVVVTHTPTGSVYTSSSRADGKFNLTNLRVGGPYTVKVSFIGYQPFVQNDINLTIGQDLPLKIKLIDNATTLTEVKVTGTANKVINSSRTGASETITRSQIDALPTISRSLSDFTKYTPSANGLSFGGRSNLFNNITVDGALFNNSFGLSGTLGGQTSSQPISLDAIDQIQVDIAPYDVRQGNFTGAGVNTTVKSGTNQVKATIYDYVRGTSLTGYQAGTTGVAVVPFTYRTTGLSVGGPIVPNKLFLFVSGEQERISQPAHTYVASGSGASGSTSLVKASDLDALSAYLVDPSKGWSYDPGPYQGFNYQTYSDKLTAKLDWNIGKNSVLSAKYFYLKSYKDQSPSSSSTAYGSSTRFAGTNGLPFYGSGYRINNNFNIGILELVSHLSSKVSNKLTVGYSALRDYRASLSSSTIPMVDIGNGTSTTSATAVATSFGYEQFTAGNILNSNIWQFSDDLTIFSGNHEITLGTSNQIQAYTNGFATQYNGVYSFNSFADFENNAPATSYTFRYSALPDGSFPYVNIKGQVFSLYLQDKFQVNNNLKLTYGLRADYDSFPTSLQQNPYVTGFTFQGGTHVDPSVLPKNRILLSPRLGFNWDVKGDQSLQVRGGSGLFAGAVPFVWISNQASNNGVLFGSYTVNSSSSAALKTQLYFNPNVDANRPAAGAGAANTSYELDITDPNLKLPKIWRTNLAVDKQLPGGFIATLEGSFTKDINAIYHKNLVLSDGYTTLPGVEGQIRYTSSNVTPFNGSTLTAANPKVTALYYMTNTNQGYSWFATAQIQRPVVKGLSFSAAYTYSVSKDVNDGGSTASTIWSSRYVAGDPNADNLSNSSYVQPNRIIAYVTYKKSFFKNTVTSFGLSMESANNGAISYTTSGDPNNDGASNDLMYIPAAQSDILLVPNGATDTRTASQLWTQLNNFINQDRYLSQHRGQYAERNGAILPYYQMYNLNLSHEFFINVGKNRHSLKFEFNIFNLGNFLNPNWGLAQVSAVSGSSSGSVALLKYMGTDATSGRPTYAFPYLDATNAIPVTTSYKNDSSQFSRWQAQFGVRYSFN
jgi:hypothetical protein